MAIYSELKYFTIPLPMGDGVTNQCIGGLKNGAKVAVPMVSQNSDYIEILELVEAGEITIAAADA